MKKNKIHLIIWKAQFGGIEVLLQSYLQRLSNNFYPDVIPLRPIEKKSVIPFSTDVINKKIGHRLSIVIYFRLFVLLIQNRSSRFITFNGGPFVLFLLSCLAPNRTIYAIHGTKYWKSKFTYFTRKTFFLLSRPSKIKFIANSNFSKSIFQSSVLPKASIKVIYNPIDTKKFHVDENRFYSDYPENIIYAGRFAKNKNLITWIVTAKAIHSVYPNCRFRLIGEGPVIEELKRKISDLKVDNIIEIRPFTEHIEKEYLWADLFIFLSEYESFGNVLIESILCGTPVITTDIPSAREIFYNYPEMMIQLDGNITDQVLEKMKEYSVLREKTMAMIPEFIENFSKIKHFSKLDQVLNEIS